MNLKSKWLAIPMMATALSAATIVPTQNAHAVLGLASGDIILTVIGALFIADSADWYTYHRWWRSNEALWLGIIFLDGSQGQDFQFTTLDSSEQVQAAQKAGLTAQEIAAFQDDEQIDLLNGIKAKMIASESGASSAQDREAAQGVWNQEKAQLKPETISAAQKLIQAGAKAN